MAQFVDLSRRFRELTQAELDEPELLALANDQHYLASLSWPELLEHPRVLVLAEAGSGKTIEMQQQVARLRVERKHAFFLALESLDRESLADALGAGDERLFDDWKAAGTAQASFFLDAVDELKLTQGKLERALRHFAKAVAGFLNQVSVVITGRPSDWRPAFDMATLQETLPYSPTAASLPPEDEAFLAALTAERGSESKETKPKPAGFRTMVLLPLGERQISTFAASLSVSDPVAFIQEIRAQHAWQFARRPLDLSELAASWNSSGKLGTRTEQHEANTNAKLKDNPDRADSGVLTDVRAREGAERLALALALTRTRTIRSPEQSVEVQHVDGALDPAVVLGDWHHAERRALLSRALFDPATYGRVRFHSVSELLRLIKRTPEPGSSTSGFNWQLREIARTIDIATPDAVALTDQLAALIWESRAKEQKFYEISARYDYLAAALALLCHRRLAAAGPSFPPDPDLLRACAIANRFGKGESGGRESLGDLRGLFNDNPQLRAAAFWVEMDLMDELAAPRTNLDRMYFAEHDGLIVHFMERDRPWLRAALSDRRNAKYRGVALQALGRLWWQGGRNEAEGRALMKAVRDSAALKREATAVLAPPVENPEWREMEQREAERRRSRERREKKRLADWQKWRRSIKARPARAFGPREINQTLSNLYKWLSARPGAHNRYDAWDLGAIAGAFGQDIARRASIAFQQYWRTVRPALWTERPPAERNSTPWLWLYGLSGIAAEATSPTWAARLTAIDAQAAARYGTLELNGFPSWLTALARERPREVDAVLGAELTAQLAVAKDYEHLPMLQDLTHADDLIKRLFAPRCQAGLMSWPKTFGNEEETKRSLHKLSQVLQVLSDVAPSAARSKIAAECARRFSAAPAGKLGLVWLRGLFRFDPVAGAAKLQQGLAAVKIQARPQRAVELLASLFGDREGIPLAIQDNTIRALILKQMVMAAYKYVPPRRDKRHEGVYTPDTRDHAESARNYLLQTLLDTPGPAARNVILELADNPHFAHFPDRLRYRRASAQRRTPNSTHFLPQTSPIWKAG